MHGTIKSSAEISYIFSHGKRYHTAGVQILIVRDSSQHGRMGRVAFIAGKKNGNAVWRNAAKRRMRNVCSALGGPWPGIDIVFLAKKNVMALSYSKVCQECEKVFELILPLVNKV